MNVISYRALKKLVGETSLERKCRFLFGLALLVLITTSFYLYALRTRALVENQQVLAARRLVSKILQQKHYRLFLSGNAAEFPPGEAPPPQETRTEPGDGTSESTPSPSVLPPEPAAAADASGNSSPGNNDSEPSNAASDGISQRRRILELFDRTVNDIPEFAAGINLELESADDTPGTELALEAWRVLRDAAVPQDEYWKIVEEVESPRKLIYYGAIRPGDACVSCHIRDLERLRSAEQAARSGMAPLPAEAEPEKTPRPPLMALARITISLENVDEQLSRNRAVLLASGIITSFLAMMAAYAIVRYIIVKPVLHLKDVSDEIARGNLNLRAEINTGDEFEELSHAFNRMLRHMMTVNDELRGLNLSLDGKVDQLARANMELFNNNKLKDDFLATMSHELRTPLNSILGFSDILQTAANLDERQKRYVRNIQTSGQSLMVQINDLLDLAKIESGKMELHPGNVVLGEILEHQVQQVLPLADRKNIDLRIDQPLKPLPTLHQDRGKISQILTNLLSNAIKFTPEGGRVRVNSRTADSAFVEFSVEDTGIGIPLREQDHIFEKFRQGSTAPEGRDHVKREYEGTGLGLSIVRELARLLGGDVNLQSEFGKGSLFVVRLPVTAPMREPEKSAPLENRTSASGLGRITSVDLLKSQRTESAADSEAAATRQPSSQ